MPIKQSLMRALKKKYGKNKGRSVYFMMENKGVPPFGHKKKKLTDRQEAARRRLRKKG
ncbi:MAG: hypothetical protein DDT19_00248 [Syntrophomonadaceae bacterium]|nr:hypothetical protein [Bacillota bacterium]